jgi:hypothetical protein
MVQMRVCVWTVSRKGAEGAKIRKEGVLFNPRKGLVWLFLSLHNIDYVGVLSYEGRRIMARGVGFNWDGVPGAILAFEGKHAR